MIVDTLPLGTPTPSAPLERPRRDTFVDEEDEAATFPRSDVVPKKPDAEDRVGSLVGGAYQLTRLIGTGSAGTVYQGVHLPTREPVAIKLLRSRWSGSEQQRKRFEREAHTSSLLRHENIVRLYDAGLDADGTAWQALELLHGRELASAIEERPLDPVEVVQVGRQLLAALGHVHRRGFVHRDVKPENVFLVDHPDGGLRVKLLDFGIAKPLQPSDTAPWLTEEGVLLGTPHYMAPEQITGELPVTPATDLWAAGAVLFTCLAGRAPFVDGRLSRLLVQIAREPAPSVAMHRSDVPRLLAEVIARALRTHPAHRYRQAEDMIAALDRCAADSVF